MSKPDPFLDLDPASASAILDPFDPAALRLTPDFVETVGVKKLLTTVPCRKPQSGARRPLWPRTPIVLSPIAEAWKKL
jgi:hypothetical protein